MARLIKSFFILILSLFIFTSLVACEGKDSGKVSIIITGADTIFVGDEIILDAVVKNSEEAVTWSSKNPDIATVEDGHVLGISPGSAKIIAQIGNKKDEFVVKVKDKMGENVSLFCGVNFESEEAIVNEKVEFALVERQAGYIVNNYNPFDYKEIKVYAVFTSPARDKNIVSCAFWYRDYVVMLNTNLATGKVKEGEPDGLETIKWTGDYEYRIRFQPNVTGVWTYKIYTELADGYLSEELSGEINVVGETTGYHGLVQIDKSNNRTFMFEDGTTFMPIGENIGWWADNSRKIYDYKVWFENCKENNMNIARVWMAPWGFCLHWGNSIYDLSDRLNYAARLDILFEYAEENDMYIMLTLLNHGQFSTGADPTWSENPYNVKNGGILDKPQQFFTNAEAKKVYKNELMYIISRYGYTDNILCWELFNEVDWTDSADINAIRIKEWHQEMGEFVKANDSYHHLVSTSYKTTQGASFSLDVIDFACPHDYGYANKNICDTLPATLDKLYNQYNKPILQAEIGINWENGISNYKLDPTGVHLRQNSWAGMMGGGCGGAMNWWWDSYVHPYDLYYQFKGAGAYAKLMNLTGSDYTQLRTLAGVSTNNNTGLIGYRFDNRIYGYVYDKAWKYNNETGELQNTTVSIPFTNGTYTLTIYNALTGNQIKSSEINVTGGACSFTLPAFTSDIAFIVE